MSSTSNFLNSSPLSSTAFASSPGGSDTHSPHGGGIRHSITPHRLKETKRTTFYFGVSSLFAFLALATVLLASLYRSDLTSQHLLFQARASAQLDGFRSRFERLFDRVSAAAVGMQGLPREHWNRSAVVPLLLGKSAASQGQVTSRDALMLVERIDGNPKLRLEEVAGDLGLSFEDIRCVERLENNTEYLADIPVEELAQSLQDQDISVVQYDVANSSVYESLKLNRKHYFIPTYRSDMDVEGDVSPRTASMSCVDIYQQRILRLRLAHMWQSRTTVSHPPVSSRSTESVVIPLLSPIVTPTADGDRLQAYITGFFDAERERTLFEELFGNLGWEFKDSCSQQVFLAHENPRGPRLDTVAQGLNYLLSILGLMPDVGSFLDQHSVFHDLIIGDSGSSRDRCRLKFGHTSPSAFVRTVYNPSHFEFDTEAVLGGRVYTIRIWATPAFFDGSMRYNLPLLLGVLFLISCGLSVAASAILWQVSMQVDARAQAAASQRRADRAWAEVQAHERVIGYIHHEVKNPLNVVVGTIDLIDDVLAAALRARHRRVYQKARQLRMMEDGSRASETTGPPDSMDSRYQSSPGVSTATSLMSSRTSMSDRTLKQLRGDIRVLREAAQQVERQVEDMLDFTRLRRGEMDVKMEPTKVSQLLKDLVRDHQSLTKVPIIVKIEDVRGLRVITDSVRVRPINSKWPIQCLPSHERRVHHAAGALSSGGERPYRA